MNNMKVCKFGGTSMANANTIECVKRIVDADADRRFIVVSAPGKRCDGDEKVTDMLYDLKREFDKTCEISDKFERLEARFESIQSGLGTRLNLDREFDEIKAKLKSGATSDFVASRGEYLSAKIFAEYIGADFVDAKDLIKFGSNGELQFEKTIFALQSALLNLKKAVIPGFYGSTDDGEIKTFSRGGSDVTGALVARAVGASVYENWTDVDGIYSADPRKHKDVVMIERLCYKQMYALALNGANVLHKDAVYPVEEAGIPINIKNTFNPRCFGSWIE